MFEEELVGAGDDQTQHGQKLPLAGRVEDDVEGLHQVVHVAFGVVDVQTVDELLPLEVVEQEVERVVQLPHVGRQRPRAGGHRVGRGAERHALQVGAAHPGLCDRDTAPHRCVVRVQASRAGGAVQTGCWASLPLEDVYSGYIHAVRL